MHGSAHIIIEYQMPENKPFKICVLFALNCIRYINKFLRSGTSTPQHINTLSSIHRIRNDQPHSFIFIVLLLFLSHSLSFSFCFAAGGGGALLFQFVFFSVALYCQSYYTDNDASNNNNEKRRTISVNMKGARVALVALLLFIHFLFPTVWISAARTKCFNCKLHKVLCGWKKNNEDEKKSKKKHKH